MKILIINSLYTPDLFGGAERSVQLLAESLVQFGHRVTVVSLSRTPGVHVDQVNGVNVYYVGLKNIYWPFPDARRFKGLKPFWHALDSYNPLMAREVESILKVEQPDLVHTNVLAGFSCAIWKTIERSRIPLVHTLRDYYLLCPRSTMFRRRGSCSAQCADCRMYGLARIRVSQVAGAVVGVSRFILKHHLEYGYFSDTREKRTIYNACNSNVTTKSSRKRSMMVRFGYLGRLDYSKGIEILVEAANALPKTTWSLRIAGRGTIPFEEHLRAKCRRPEITLVGSVEPDAFFSEVDVLVVPSLWNEPFGRVIVEAYAHGVPVVGACRGGIPELIEEERTGYLFDPGRIKELTRRMQRYIDTPALVDSMSAACLRKAESFLPKHITQQYLEVYAGLQPGPQ